MESGRQREGSRTRVPSRYRVLLNTADLVALSGREALPAELGESLRDFARRRGYVLPARPLVKLEASPRVDAGQVLVMTDPEPPIGRASADAAGSAPAIPSEAAGAEPAAGSAEAPPGDRSQPDAPDTSVYRASAPEVPRARIAARTPNGHVERIPVRGGTLRVGRALDNDVVLDDAAVSRHHAQITVRLGTLIYTDLASTNGSFLQGNRVHEIALGPDDVIQLGGSSLTIEPTAG